MSNFRQIILTTEETGEEWSACIWDPKTGTALKTYKGPPAAGPRSACFLGNDYLLLSDKTQPVLNVWFLNKEKPIMSARLLCPDVVNAMAATPDGNYVVTATGKKLIIWQITLGKELAELECHFQPITCVKFTDDGSHFISGGEDGQALVWSLTNVLENCHRRQTQPHYKFSEHTLPIQDIFVGSGGMKACFATVSLDKSCKIYDLSCGHLLTTVVFENSLGAVTMNADETVLFVGTLNGNIIQLDLNSLPKTWEHHVSDEKGKVFLGHSKLVTCLSVSHNGMFLLSGSNDRRAILWNIYSRHIITTIQHKGSIMNAFFAMAHKKMFSKAFMPVLVLKSPENVKKIYKNSIWDYCRF